MSAMKKLAPRTAARARVRVRVRAAAYAQPSDDSPTTQRRRGRPADGRRRAPSTSEAEATGSDRSTSTSFNCPTTRGKDEYGGKFGDGKMIDETHGRHDETGKRRRGADVASLHLHAPQLRHLARHPREVRRARPARKVAAERHDQIKTALDEAAKLREQAQTSSPSTRRASRTPTPRSRRWSTASAPTPRPTRSASSRPPRRQAAQMKRDAELRIAAEIELARAQLTREVTDAPRPPRPRSCSARRSPPTIRSKLVGDVHHRTCGSRRRERADGHRKSRPPLRQGRLRDRHASTAASTRSAPICARSPRR